MNINRHISIFAIVTAVDHCHSVTMWPLNRSDIIQAHGHGTVISPYIAKGHVFKCQTHSLHIPRENLIFHGYPSAFLLVFKFVVFSLDNYIDNPLESKMSLGSCSF